MSGEFKNAVKVACIYATNVIGAGFASGQEIMQFFSAYKTGGFFGILLAGILFALVGSIVLDRVYCERIRNYEEFIFPAFGWRLGWIVEAAVTVFMLCLFCIMVAGSGSVLADSLGIPFKLAVVITGLACLVLILTNIKGIVALSAFATPILVVGIIFAGMYIIFFSDSETFSIYGYFKLITGNWFFSSLLYVSYNIIPSIVVMCSLLPYLKTRRTAILGGIAGGTMLLLAALVINTVIHLYYPVVFQKELPILEILKKLGSLAGGLYAVVLWLAMFTSAVTSGFCFSGRIESILKLDRKVAAVLLCAAAIPLSTLGFSDLISIIYPVFGYLGLFMVIAILFHGMAKPHS